MIQDNTENELDQAAIDTPLYLQINFIISFQCFKSLDMSGTDLQN